MAIRSMITLRRGLTVGVLGVCLCGVAASAQAPAQMMRPANRMASRQVHMELMLAQRLAGLQVYLGITPAELPQWNAFTAAVLAMPTPRPDRGADADDPFAGIDAMAQRMQQRAAAAQTVSHAAADLKSVLTPDQITKADAAWSSMQQGWDHGMHRPGGWQQHGRMAPNGFQGRP